MIFIAKADGTLEKVFPEAVNQGSVGVNKLILVAPFVAGTVITAACKLPNGIYTKPTLLRKATVPSLSPTEYGESYNAWECTLDAAVTQYPGTVTVQFFVKGNGTETVLATYADALTVTKGVMPELPDAPDDKTYQEILAALSGVGIRLTAAENTIESNTKIIGAHENSIDTHSAEISQLQAMRIEETELESGDKEYSLVFYDKNEGGVASHGATFTIPLSRISALEGDVETAEKDIEDLKAYDETSKGKFAVLETAKIKKGTDGNGDPVYSFVWTEDGAEERQGEEITIPIKRIKAVEDKVNGLSILTNVSFNSSTEKLYFTFSSGNTVEIDISEFVDVNELADRINNELGASVVANAEAAVKPYRDEAQAFSVSAQKQAGYSQQYASDASARAEAARKYAERAEASAQSAANSASEADAARESAMMEANTAGSKAIDASYYASQAKASASVASDAASRISVFDKRLQNLENGISPDPFYTDYTVAYQKDVPARALPFAALGRLGGMSYKSKNLFNIDATPTWNDNTVSTLKKVDDVTFISTNSNGSGGGNGIYIGTFDAGVTITVSGYFKCSSDRASFMNVVTPKNGSGSFTKGMGYVSEYTTFFHTFTTVDSNKEYYYRPAYATTYEADLSITLKNVQIEVGSVKTDYMPYFEGIRHAAVTKIESKSANLATETEFTATTMYVYTLATPLQAGKTYTITGKGKCSTQNMLVNMSADGSTSLDSKYSFYFYGDGNIGKKTVTVAVDTTITALLCYASNNYNNSRGLEFSVSEIMIVEGSTASPFYPQHIGTFYIPEEYRSLYGYGLGISADVHNYIDLDRNKYVQMCSIRAYQSGDENNPEVITDGTIAVYPLSSPVETDIAPIDNYIRVGGGGTLTFVNEHSMAVPSTVSYLMKEASV